MRINLVSIGISIILGSILIAILVFGIMLTRARDVPLPTRQAVITVLPVIPTTTPQPTIILEPTKSDEKIASDDGDGVTEFSIGDYVEIYGTGGDGLRIRKAPGLSGEVLFLGLESEIFIIKDGPVEQDGFVWWLIESPSVTGLGGWAAGNYLTMTEQP